MNQAISVKFLFNFVRGVEKDVYLVNAVRDLRGVCGVLSVINVNTNNVLFAMRVACDRG